MSDGGHMFVVRLRNNDNPSRDTAQEFLETAILQALDQSADYSTEESQVWIEATCIHQGPEFVDYKVPKNRE